jgi:hypothetical protein
LVTVPVHSVTSRFWIGFGSALVAGMLLAGEVLLVSVATHQMTDLLVSLIIGGAIAAFITAAELLVSTRLPAGWATAVVIFTLFLIVSIDLSGIQDVGKFLFWAGRIAVAAGVSAACAIRLGNRLRLPVMAASSILLGCGLLTCSIWVASTSAQRNVDQLVMGLGQGFAFGLSAGVGVLLWQFLCGRRLSQSPADTV